MIEWIEANGQQLALIVRREDKAEGIKFLTPDHFSQQLGMMTRVKGYRIQPHVHLPVVREVEYTKEVLLIRSGKVRVDFYTADKSYTCSRLLLAGDVVLLAFGGHGFEMLEDSDILEIKQGPYAGDRDKERFMASPESRAST